MKTAHLICIALAGAALFLTGCALTTGPDKRSPETASPDTFRQVLTPAQDYAGEVLAYFLRVTLGNAGRPKLRAQWQRRGISVALDFDAISQQMSRPGANRSELLVLDANLLPLGRVLYHYNSRLNQFKVGSQRSVYPSNELIALRLLLVQKISRGEKIDLTSLLAQRDRFRSTAPAPSAAELSAMGLKRQEFRLLQAALISEPSLWHYLRHPFIIKALADVGALEKTATVRSAIQKAVYRPHCAKPVKYDVITISLLPSLIAVSGNAEGGSVDQEPSLDQMPEYNASLARLKRRIMAAVHQRLKDQNPEMGQNADWAHRIRYIDGFRKPLVVYPANIAAIVDQICPELDFNLVILGKEVYRAVDIDPDRDVYPKSNILYLDLMDLVQSRFDNEAEQVAEFVISKLQPGMRAAP